MPATERISDAAKKFSADLALLTELNEGFLRAVAGSDVGWLDRHLAPDFLNSNPDGTLADRIGYLNQVARPVTVSGLRCEDVRVRIMGDTAIIHARTAYRKVDGQPGTGRVTGVWMRNSDGRWACIAGHVTRG